MSKRKLQSGDDMLVDETSPSTPISGKTKRSRRISDVIDSVRITEYMQAPGHSTPQQKMPAHVDLVSPDQGYEGTPCNDPGIIPSWMHKRTDHIDATPPGPSDENEKEQTVVGTPSGITAMMPVSRESEQYNMSHANRGTCLIFNHEVFETGFSKREGSSIDAKRIEATFTKLGFDVVIRDNLEHSDVLDEINKLSSADHTNNDCVCVFLLTHGLNNNLVMAKDVAYRADKIWKPFTADVCPTLAGKPKLFFYQACRGDKLDGGVMLMSRTSNTQTDSAVASYKIPTHSDFLIAHSSVDGFFSWRNPEEGTWYIQCLCSVLDQFAETTDLMRMLTITARKVATEFQSYDDMNLQKNEQKQVPSTTSMLTRDLYFKPK
ncbi:caspase-1-like [Neodiprion virginianus]|uniref:caspase-1-like n=1 Tax=Neodiprion virginianus TaxID=2961670 RepID=UPI001EE7806A|nr:caspase-1-like [Neodiprion virginianus]